MSNSTTWVWLDGSLVQPDKAMVNIFDHGFLYGDSVYETMRSFDGQVAHMDPHLERLMLSASALELTVPLSRKELVAAIHQVLGVRPSGMEAGIRLMVTRGVGPMGMEIDLCQDPKVIIIGWAIPPGDHAHFESGISLVVAETRRNSPSALSPHIKSGNFLNNKLAYREAKKQSAYEAVFLSPDHTVAECTTSNLFWVKNNEVYTCGTRGILLGVTRKCVLDILQSISVPCHEGHYPVEDLRAADEVFITSSLKGVLPAIELDGRAVGGGKPGALTRQIAELYFSQLGSG